MDRTAQMNALQDALPALSARDQEFAKSLIKQYQGRGLSEKQWYWVGKLAERAAAPPPEPKSVGDASALYGVFSTVMSKMKGRKPRLTLVGVDAEGGEHRVSVFMAGASSKFPNILNVKDRDSGTWYARVFPTGEVHARQTTPEWVLRFLAELVQDPLTAAVKHGKMTNHCMCCGRQLTDPKSVGGGVGPICADRWGFEWGKVLEIAALLDSQKSAA